MQAKKYHSHNDVRPAVDSVVQPSADILQPAKRCSGDPMDILQTYNHFLTLTGEPAAAATLTLAALQSKERQERANVESRKA